ncbi:transcription termination factor MTEF18, mitochondrial [Castanea sativa]|uniref:transcription termination factor MTEF18, mitochondrial n=1 Tax=Castanea sativa TaxID=21020 RepID=UPI003F6522DC
MPISNSLFTILTHRFSTTRNLSKLPNLSKIPGKYRPQAIHEAQKALTDYLHATRTLPFTYAEHIAKNSLFSVSNLIVKLEFSPTDFSKSFQRFLRYHPINEFEFFFESIGLDYSEVNDFLPANKFFFSEDGTVLNAACALSGFGFPWNMLGKLYKEEVSIFSRSSDELKARLCGFKEYGFSNISVIGICLAFPHVLCGEGELGGEIDALFDDLKRVFLDFDLVSSIEGNVDAWYEVCRKIRVFYDLGCVKGTMGELMGRSKHVFIEYPEEVLVQKAEYFCRFGVGKEDVGLLLLQSPEILSLDLETPVVSVLGFLKHFGLDTEELMLVSQKYPYVFGRNKMANLPNVLRALNLHEWFFNKIKNGSHQLLANYVLSDPDEGLDREFRDGLDKIQYSRTPIHNMNKLNFLHGIGFGENALTMKVLAHLHGTSSELQERFDCLLRLGVKFSNLCMMVKSTPKVINQRPETIEQKVNFLCHEMGSSLEYLDIFPAFLCFDLENRIKPRYSFHMRLTEKGLCKKPYSIASIIATSEKNFVARLSGIHPDAPKKWSEYISCKKSQGS